MKTNSGEFVIVSLLSAGVSIFDSSSCSIFTFSSFLTSVASFLISFVVIFNPSSFNLSIVTTPLCNALLMEIVSLFTFKR